MDLKLNHIFNLTAEEIRNSRIELNMEVGKGGERFIDRWLNFTDEEKALGQCNNCSFWGWAGNKRNFKPSQWVFSFVRIADDDWLFISAGEVKEIPENSWAIVEILDKFRPLFGRLIIKCKKGNTYSRYVFKMSTYLEKSIVKEVLPCIYSGETFEGYDRVHLPYSRLASIFEGKILPTYYEALGKITGVYCLTDTRTGKLYIGSATGEGGIKQRWSNYLDSKDGGNKKLVELKRKEGEEYFEKNFTFTLLEYFSLSYDPEKVKERERYWKECLNTVEKGYNANY